MADFSKKNTHEQNIQISIDKILGAPTKVKRARKTAEDHKRALFNQFIDAMLFISHRAQELDGEFCMDMAKYDAVFLDVIETVLNLHFTKKQIELIYFFLYDRVGIDGKIVSLADEDTDEPLLMNNPDELWETLKKYP